MSGPTAPFGSLAVSGSFEASSSASVIRALVVDAHPVTRWGLMRVMESQPDMASVGEAGSAREALDLVAATAPDVITVGVTLPDRDGLELVRELRDAYPALGIVVLTHQGEDSVLFRALDHGASAFVTKQADAAEILAAIRHSAAAAWSFSASGLAQALRRRAEQPQSPALSAREFQVLELLRDGRSIPQVASRLHLSLSTSKTYVARLYEKLGAANRAQALMAAVRMGLIEQSEPVSVIDLTGATAFAR